MNPGGQETPDKFKLHAIVPPRDIHLEEAIEDFLALVSDAELKKEPYLREYVTEQLGRWGRWTHRGRAPAICFEAACSGATRFLEKRGINSTECTARMDAALSRALAGMIVNAVEPDAVSIFFAMHVSLWTVHGIGRDTFKLS